jgi:PhnB protein
MTDHTAQGPLGGLTPHITVADAPAAIDFYKAAFGAVELSRMVAEDGRRLMHAHLMVNGAALMMHDDFPEYRGGTPLAEPSGVTLHLQVDDADRWMERAVAADFSDPRMDPAQNPMPFDGKRMIFGGFMPVVTL